MTPCACPPTQPLPGISDPRPTAQELWQRYHQGSDGPVENALVEQYLPLVRSVLGRLAMNLPEHVDQDDLRSAGLLGLLQALRNFDPACGTSFETYARLRVRGSMLDELRRMDWVPRAVHEKARKIRDTMVRLEQALGRVAADAEVARALQLSSSEYAALLNEVRPATFVCLDAVCSTESGETSTWSEMLPDPAEDGPVEQVSRNELKEIVLRRLTELPANQRKVVAFYYGEDLRLREIAEVLGVTESRVCKIHSEAILSIRAYVQRFEGSPATAGKAAPN
jgi:RNA polymerase sigma factor for flagellar operon FliA